MSQRNLIPIEKTGILTENHFSVRSEQQWRPDRPSEEPGPVDGLAGYMSGGGEVRKDTRIQPEAEESENRAPGGPQPVPFQASQHCILLVPIFYQSLLLWLVRSLSPRVEQNSGG
jgi:hypothetical protein